MSFVSILYRLIIYPLELLFEVIFRLSEKSVHNPGVSIIVLSLVVNFLVLPLYRRADAMQEEERDISAKMAPWLTHIRKTFKGDERFMMQQTYYRQMGYKQVYVLRSSIPLLLQIPFFIAAYHFLSHLNYLSGVSLGPIKDLAEPDKLIKLGGGAINFLPILMTVINITAGAIYSKGFPIKTKIQMYGIAAIFLVLLYDSPAGLVFYWTLNNVFSLMKNIVAALSKRYGKSGNTKSVKNIKIDGTTHALWFIGALILTLMTGLLISAGTIASAPHDFILLNNYINPMWLILCCLLTAAGFFLVWFGVFYLLAGPRGKTVMAFLSTILASGAVINCFFLVRGNASVSTTLVFQAEYHATSQAEMTNIVTLLALVLGIAGLWKYRRKVLPVIMLIPLIAVLFMSGDNTFKAYRALKDEYYLGENYLTTVDMNLSTDGHNVVVIMLDRAIGEYVPFIMDNNPELMAQFDGFTYYSNVISYGQNTLFGAPALYGGPEYSVENMNLDADRSLADKVNESLKVMPVLFAQNGYEVTVTDPPYAGYKWIPDLSIYDDYENITTAVVQGAVSDSYPGYSENSDAILERQERNFFCYSLVKVVPGSLIDFFYDDGNYNAIEYGSGSRSLGSTHFNAYIDSYTELAALPDMTVINDDASDHFLMIDNNMTHEYMKLYDNKYGDGLTSGDRFLPLDDNARICHVQINEEAYRTLGEWFDMLRAEGVWDNTRIILVSDHGYYLGQDQDLLMDYDIDLMAYFPLLMVKDFDQEGFTVNDDFAVNALVPYLATEGLFDDGAYNPFTGVPFSTDFLQEDQIIVASGSISPEENPGNRFADANWFILHGHDIRNSTLEPIPAP